MKLAYLPFLILCFTGTFITAQPVVKDIPLPATMAHANNEYSSMAIWNDEILLVPQYPAKYIYSLNKTGISNFTAGSSFSNDISKTYRFVHWYEVIAKIANYEGVEATTIIDNSIYFSIETTNPTDCYVVKGKIAESDGKAFIVMDTTKLLALKKPLTKQGKLIDNAGFESMVYDGKGSIIAMYEYNRADVDGGPFAYKFDTSLNKTSLKKVPFGTPLPYRLTDAVTTAQGQILAMNYNWNGDKQYHSAGEMVNCSGNVQKDVSKTCYSRVIELEINNTITYKEILQTECTGVESQLTRKSMGCYNWEGIVPFENGVLVITDQYPGSYLRYYSFK